MIGYQKALENKGFSLSTKEETEAQNTKQLSHLFRIRYIRSKPKAPIKPLSEGSVVVISVVQQIFMALHLPGTW